MDYLTVKFVLGGVIKIKYLRSAIVSVRLFIDLISINFHINYVFLYVLKNES
jgi:hypothetical protein